MLGTTYPMKVSDALLATARDDEQHGDRHGQHLVALVDRAQALVPRRRASSVMGGRAA
jgi:hypothetical protein